MNIVILPSAQEDLADDFAFYERQSPGLGTYFFESLSSDIDSLLLYAGVHRKAFGFHRLLSRRFPYAVYYSVGSETAFVRAVLDCRSDPIWIQKRLR